MFGNSTKIFDNRYDERNAFLAADFFGFAFWIAGDEWAVGAGRGLRGPKNADVVVDLALERICIDETIDAHGSEEMADAFSHAALGNFLAQREWRSERSPVCAAKHATKYVDHDGKRVTLVPAAFAIGAER